MTLSLFYTIGVVAGFILALLVAAFRPHRVRLTCLLFALATAFAFASVALKGDIASCIINLAFTAYFMYRAFTAKA